MNLHIETDREEDGRWLADVVDLPGVLAYGPTRTAAITAVKALALRVLADQLDSGELAPDSLADVHFVQAAA
ncbi:MAG TPA: type II toxin-antitoxin system HicB family antitoxin [Planctomycetota bacterium]|nr:type II toxin-antitoxin system HicB family antitoxin [Planctomycetota bacterium]